MTSAILFPHTQITAPCLEKILVRFGELTICLPWFMEGVLFDMEVPDISHVRILRPPDRLRPEKDILKLITEYQLWVGDNPDKGYRIFLEASKEGSFSEETPREIRQLLSGMEQHSHSDPHKTQGFKWHMILHLANDFEKNRSEAEKLLKDLKHQESPLRDAVENVPHQSFFDNTPLMQSQLQVDKYHLRQVVDAWFGLFGGSLPEEGSLITLDPQVLAYAFEIFEPDEKVISPESKPEGDFFSKTASGQSPYISRCLPRLEVRDKALDDPVVKGLSGRTIIFMED